MAKFYGKINLRQERVAEDGARKKEKNWSWTGKITVRGWDEDEGKKWLRPATHLRNDIKRGHDFFHIFVISSAICIAYSR